MKYEAKIPVNDWKPAPLREDKVNEAVASVVNSDGGALYIGYGQNGTPACRRKLTPDEIRYICRRFIEARWHVYVPELRQSGSVPVTISKLPEEEFNLGKVEHQIEVFDPDIIDF